MFNCQEIAKKLPRNFNRQKSPRNCQEIAKKMLKILIAKKRQKTP